VKTTFWRVFDRRGVLSESAALERSTRILDRLIPQLATSGPDDEDARLRGLLLIDAALTTANCLAAYKTEATWPARLRRAALVGHAERAISRALVAACEVSPALAVLGLAVLNRPDFGIGDVP
jgi:hypothetical protein